MEYRQTHIVNGAPGISVSGSFIRSRDWRPTGIDAGQGPENTHLFALRVETLKQRL
jgi:hypothetical protein